MEVSDKVTGRMACREPVVTMVPKAGGMRKVEFIKSTPDPAYGGGYDAAWAGRPAGDNPYPAGTDGHFAWAMGHDDASDIRGQEEQMAKEP